MITPESPHQAAISASSVPKVKGPFSSRVRPTLHPVAQELVKVYESVPGALTYPGCCPEALAAVLDEVNPSGWTMRELSQMLRGYVPPGDAIRAGSWLADDESLEVR